MRNTPAKIWRGLALAALFTLPLAFGCGIRKRLPNNGALPKSVFGITIRGANRAQETNQKSFLAAKVNRLQVDGNGTAGNIAISPAPEGVDEIHIQATKSVSGDRPESELKTFLPQVNTTATLQDDILIVRASYDPNTFPPNTSAAVDYTITVPRRLALSLRTNAGAIKVEGVTGGMTLHSDFGSVQMREVSGGIEADTSSGALSVTDSPQASPVRIRTDFGSIALKNVSGQIDARTSSGEISVSQAPSAQFIALHSEYGSITLDDVGGGVEAASGSGAVTITKARVKGTLTLHSDFGNVTADQIQADGNALQAKLTTSSGAVHFHGDATALTLRSDFGEITAEPSAKLPLASADLHTSSGHIELTLPASVSAAIQAKTSSGHLSISAPNTHLSTSDGGAETSQNVTLGDGKAPVNVSTDFGDITIQTAH